MADWYLEDMNGDLHKAMFVPLTMADTRKMRWDSKIYWSLEISSRDGRKAYKLTDASTGIIQGGISMIDREDHVFVHLIESATHNRSNPRNFVNVSRLLIAFAGQRSNAIPGGDGFLALTPKSSLIQYYIERFQAYIVNRQDLGILGTVTNHWIGVYYK